MLLALHEDVFDCVLIFLEDLEIMKLDVAIPKLRLQGKYLQSRILSSKDRTYGKFWRLGREVLDQIFDCVDIQSLQILDLSIVGLCYYAGNMGNRVDKFRKRCKYSCKYCYRRTECEGFLYGRKKRSWYYSCMLCSKCLISSTPFSLNDDSYG